MKNTYRCSTVASSLATRPFLAFGAVLAAFAAPTLLTGCGSGGGGGNPTPSPSAGANQTIITGRIIDVNANSAGVAGVAVRFAGATVVTDANGSFSITIGRNTAAGSATITPPAGTALYSYAANGAVCANSLTFPVAGPLTGPTFAIGNILVYSRSANTTPNPPCI